MHDSKRNTASILLLGLLFFSILTALSSSSKPRLYPKLQRYFHSLELNPIDSAHKKTLNALRSSITGSRLSNQKLTILFTCPDNSFRSQAAQIILESLIEINHITCLKVFSAGYMEREIDPRLLKLLIKKGFLVTELPAGSEKKGHWLVKFSDQMPPITIFSKSYNALSIPSSIYLLVKICSRAETMCQEVRGALFSTEWPLERIEDIQDELAMEREFDMITAAIYTTIKAAVDEKR